MWLARMEGRVAIGLLVARFERLRADAPPMRARRARFRAVSAFPVTLA
jgi:cytochrome P450